MYDIKHLGAAAVGRQIELQPANNMHECENYIRNHGFVAGTYRSHEKVCVAHDEYLGKDARQNFNETNGYHGFINLGAVKY